MSAPNRRGSRARHSCNQELVRTYPDHARASDGETWRCSCGKHFTHVCDEAEGCSWHERSAAR